MVPLPDPEQQLLHQHTGLRVETAERLVHQQPLRLHDEHTCDPNALAHPAREFGWIARLEAAQPHLLEDLRRARAVVGGLLSLRLRPEHHVFHHRKPRKQRRLLKHHRNGRLRVLLANELHSTGGRSFQTSDDVQ